MFLFLSFLVSFQAPKAWHLTIRSMLRQFMPDSLFGPDHDGMRLMLLLTRLASKSRVLLDFAVENFKLEQGLQSLPIFLHHVRRPITLTRCRPNRSYADVPRLLAEGVLTPDQIAFGNEVREVTTIVLVQAQYFIKVIVWCTSNITSRSLRCFSSSPASLPNRVSDGQTLETASVKTFHGLASSASQVAQHLHRVCSLFRSSPCLEHQWHIRSQCRLPPLKPAWMPCCGWSSMMH